MLTPLRASRPTLISTTRALLQRADEARSVPALRPWLEEAELALALLEDRHGAATVAKDRFEAQVILARESERTLDRQVMAFSHRLKGEMTGDDAIAEAAMRTLFTHGASALTKLRGRVQLTAYSVFRARLGATLLPAVLAAEPARIAAGIDSFTAILLAKEQSQRQWKATLREAEVAMVAMRRNLTLLETNAEVYLSADVMAVWSEPVRALSRRTTRLLGADAPADASA